MSRMDIRDYDNDYSTPKEEDLLEEGSGEEKMKEQLKEEEVAEKKGGKRRRPMSRSQEAIMRRQEINKQKLEKKHKANRDGVDGGYQRSRSQPQETEGVTEDKPLSASDITAIAESTVNQLLMREERKDSDRRSRSRRKTRSRSRGRSKSRGRSRSRERRRSKDKSAKSGSTGTMSRLEKLKDPRIVTLKGLKSFHKENDIRRELTEERMRFRDIRVIFNKANQSGTAFVEFQSESEAAKWVRNNRGMLKVREEYLTMDLNKPLAEPKKDWTCKTCGEKNHYARESCYSCQSEKEEEEEKPRLRSTTPEGAKGKDAIPSNVLMFRGLDYRTTEEQIHRRLRDLTNVPVKDVRLITDKFTNKSRGFCFVEVSSVADGKELMSRVQRLEPPFEIGSRKVTVTYQREPGEKNEAADAAIAAAQWSATSKSDVTGDGTSGAAAADKADPTSMPETIGSYVWDEKTGYYYDQSSGLYYDPKTKYYYNPTDENYYFWDEKNQKYENVPQTNTQTNAQATAMTNPQAAHGQAVLDNPDDKSKPSAAKVTKAMNAKKIQKDMERWAKAKNKQQAKANPPKAEPEESSVPEELSSVQSGNSIALKIAQDYADPVYQQSQQPIQIAPPPPSIFPITNMTTSPVVVSDDQINRKFEDLTAIACLLCKRKFPSIDNLKRHQELSDLHKTSLAAERQKAMSGGGGTPTEAQLAGDYRDRAAERRNKFGNEAGPPQNKFMRR